MEIHDSLFEDIELRCVGVYAKRIDMEGRYTEVVLCVSSPLVRLLLCFPISFHVEIESLDNVL